MARSLPFGKERKTLLPLPGIIFCEVLCSSPGHPSKIYEARAQSNNVRDNIGDMKLRCHLHARYQYQAEFGTSDVQSEISFIDVRYSKEFLIKRVSVRGEYRTYVYNKRLKEIRGLFTYAHVKVEDAQQFVDIGTIDIF